MNFVLWLAKRAWKPVVRKWNLPATKDKFSGKTELAFNVVLIGWLLSMCIAVIVDWIVGTAFTTPIVIAIGLIGLLVTILIACVCDAYQYLSKLHSQYRAESPKEKPKRKRKNDTPPVDKSKSSLWTIGDPDTLIESMTTHYLSIINAGLNLYDFKPERPTGEMVGNRYAEDTYTAQLIAFGQAVGINSENKDYFEEGEGEHNER